MNEPRLPKRNNRRALAPLSGLALFSLTVAGGSIFALRENQSDFELTLPPRQNYREVRKTKQELQSELPTVKAERHEEGYIPDSGDPELDELRRAFRAQRELLSMNLRRRVDAQLTTETVTFLNYHELKRIYDALEVYHASERGLAEKVFDENSKNVYLGDVGEYTFYVRYRKDKTKANSPSKVTAKLLEHRPVIWLKKPELSEKYFDQLKIQKEKRESLEVGFAVDGEQYRIQYHKKRNKHASVLMGAIKDTLIWTEFRRQELKRS